MADRAGAVTRRNSLRLVPAAALLISLLWRALPAVASCGVAPPLPAAIRRAPAVFVGTVVALENMRRWAMVEVTDVWKGEVAAEVEVRGGPPDPRGGSTVVTSVDRYMRLGVTYLFVPYRGDGGVFRDNACSNTTRYRDGLAAFRPDTAPTPTPAMPPVSGTPAPAEEGQAGPMSASWIWLVGGLALASGVLGWLLFARRRIS